MQVSLTNTASVVDFMDCSETSMQEAVQRFVLSVGQSDLQFDGNTTLRIKGMHPIRVPLVPPNNNTIGGHPWHCALQSPLCNTQPFSCIFLDACAPDGYLGSGRSCLDCLQRARHLALLPGKKPRGRGRWAFHAALSRMS